MTTDEILIAATVLVAVVPWAMSIHAKVTLIAHAMEGLPELVADTRERLHQHEKAIQALQAATVARH
jgi:hypothetical protein